VRETCIALRKINQKTMFHANEEAKSIAKRAVWSVLTIGIAAISIGFGFSLVLSNLIVKPLRQIMKATQKIADGDYDTIIATSSSDELGLLAREFNAMVSKVKSYHDLNIHQILMEQKKNEAILRDIDDGIIVLDSELKVTNVNPMAARALNIETDVAYNQHCLEVLKDEGIFNYIKQAAESGQLPVVEAEENILTIRRENVDHYYEFSITPIQVQRNESMAGVVLVLRDVTRLKELDRLKSEFVMAVSHELRTPLTSMNMSIELLRETVTEKLTSKERELFDAAHEELQRMRALINDLLDLSKIEAGKMEMEFERVPVRMMFEKSVSLFKLQAEEKTIHLYFELKEDLPDVVADANKITWVLTNLISNALRYTRTEIRLFAEKIGTQIHISVRDNGIGIPFEDQSRIFDKFVQVKDNVNTGGTGLGLAICKEIVRAHKGTIWVDSIPNEGSTFTFTLPI
jgi:NtrC-family two-component system sensor histidine kinase KinB